MTMYDLSGIGARTLIKHHPGNTCHPENCVMVYFSNSYQIFELQVLIRVTARDGPFVPREDEE